MTVESCTLPPAYLSELFILEVCLSTVVHAAEQGRLRHDDRVVLCASGGGVAMAASVLRWTLGEPGGGGG
jgi:hypothetical protein